MGAVTPMRTGSFLGSPRGSLSAGSQDSGARILPLRRSSSTVFSPHSGCTAALHLEADGRREGRFLRRAKSEADLARSSRLNRIGAEAPTHDPLSVEEEEEEEEADLQLNFHPPVGSPKRPGTASTGYSGGDHGGISGYYRRMLRSDPSNPMLLRNYGRFLQEVVGDAEGAAECYGRAILANPGDGEVLSLYGKLLWEAYGNARRAEAYFQRAVEASPDDCYVWALYARFLWNAEDEEKSPLVKAFAF